MRHHLLHPQVLVSVKQFIGIDVGLSGAIAVISDGLPPAWWPMPVVLISESKRCVDGKALAALLHGRDCVVAIESVGAMPGQGVTSMFSFGRSLGAIEGVVDALGYPRVSVKPKVWQKIVLDGMSHDKGAIIHFCRMRWPTVSLVKPGCRVDHDGAADAICIAEHARRTCT